VTVSFVLYTWVGYTATVDIHSFNEYQKSEKSKEPSGPGCGEEVSEKIV